MYLKGSDSYFEKVTLSDKETKIGFFSLKGGKASGFDKMNYDNAKKLLISCVNMNF